MKKILSLYFVIIVLQHVSYSQPN